MGGVKKTVKNIVKSPLRAGTAMVTLGGSELGNFALKKINPNLAIYNDRGGLGLTPAGMAAYGTAGAMAAGPVLGAAGGAAGFGGGTAGAAGAGTASTLATPSIATVAKAGGMTGLQKLAAVAGGGMLLSGLLNRQPEVENVLNQGDEERAQQLINELAAEQEAKRSAYLAETRKTMDARRAENVAKLQGRMAEQSRLEMPNVLEDLNSRGLFGSETAVAKAIADKQAQNSLYVQEFEAAEQARDAAIQDQIAQDIIEGRMGLEQEGLKRRFGLEDVRAQSRLAQALARRQAAAQRDQALVQSGSQILGYSILPRLLGV